MQLARLSSFGPDGPEPRILVRRDGSAWTDLRHAIRLGLERTGATTEAAARIAAAIAPSSLSAAIAAGDRFVEAARSALADAPGAATVSADAALVNALDPVAYRDFMSFDGHFST